MEFASKGVAGTALGLGAGALGVELLRGGLGGLFGGGQQMCHENMPVNRYELSLQQENAALKTQVEMHKAEIYTDNKLEALDDRYNKRFSRIEERMAEQAVHNATSDGVLGCMAQQIAALNNLTRLIVPASSVCPAPMPQYNSWVAPTTTTTGGA